MTKTQRQKAMKLAAEKYFDRWWRKEDRYYVSHQIAVQLGFIAGAKWAMRKKKKGRKRR